MKKEKKRRKKLQEEIIRKKLEEGMIIISNIYKQQDVDIVDAVVQVAEIGLKIEAKDAIRRE